MSFAARDEVIGRHITEFLTPEAARQHRETHWPRLLAEDAFDAVEYPSCSCRSTAGGWSGTPSRRG